MNDQLVIIKPRKNFLTIDFKELWRYRDLFYIFAWRDIKVRYKKTILGASWAIFQPITSTFIFTIFFGKLANVPSGDLPYPVFVLCGLVFWGFFSGSLSHASNSLIDNENIIKKVYFPKIILPLSSVVTSSIDFLINFIILCLYLLILRETPSGLFIPVVIIGIIITTIGASGLGLFLSALNVKYRDVRYILPFFIQTLLFLTPVIYPTSIISNTNKYIMALNPMTGVIESVRTTISGNSSIDLTLLGISLGSAILYFIIGVFYFRQTEDFFADIV